MNAGIQIGDVLRVQFPAQRPPGHEQIGTRPAVVVGIPDRVGAPRFPSLMVVPFTEKGLGGKPTLSRVGWIAQPPVRAGC